MVGCQFVVVVTLFNQETNDAIRVKDEIGSHRLLAADDGHEAL